MMQGRPFRPSEGRGKRREERRRGDLDTVLFCLLSRMQGSPGKGEGRIGQRGCRAEIYPRHAVGSLGGKKREREGEKVRGGGQSA